MGSVICELRDIGLQKKTLVNSAAAVTMLLRSGKPEQAVKAESSGLGQCIL